MKKAVMEFVTFDAQDVITTSTSGVGPVAWFIPGTLVNSDDGGNWNAQMFTSYFYIFNDKGVGYQINQPQGKPYFKKNSNYQLEKNSSNSVIKANEVFVNVSETNAPAGFQVTEWRDLIEWITKYGQ